LGVDGRGLLDPPFWDLVWESTTGTDIFSLGSIFYTIVTGHWPYKSDNLPEEDTWQYEGRVIGMLEQGMYPQVEGISGGTIMMGCWQKLYSTAEDPKGTRRIRLLDCNAEKSSWMIGWIVGGFATPTQIIQETDKQRHRRER
jgi:serine/threonine protein kinase